MMPENKTFDNSSFLEWARENETKKPGQKICRYPMVTWAYPAFLISVSGGYSIKIPDVGGLTVEAKTLENAVENARELLTWQLLAIEKAGEKLPKPSDLFQMLDYGQTVIVLDVQLKEYRRESARPASPYLDYEGAFVWKCGGCNELIFRSTNRQADRAAAEQMKYCQHCGKPILWEEQ